MARVSALYLWLDSASNSIGLPIALVMSNMGVADFESALDRLRQDSFSRLQQDIQQLQELAVPQLLSESEQMRDRFVQNANLRSKDCPQGEFLPLPANAAAPSPGSFQALLKEPTLLAGCHMQLFISNSQDGCGVFGVL